MDNVQQQAKFIKISPKKVGTMAIITLSFYYFVWFYRQWKCLKKNDPDYSRISPFWRAVFYPFYSFSFVKAIEREHVVLPPPVEDDTESEAARGSLTSLPYFIFVFIVLLIVTWYLPDSMDKVSGITGGVAVLLIIYTMSFLQRCVNAALPADMLNEGFVKPADFLSILPLLLGIVVIFILPFFFIFFSGPMFDDKCYKHNVINSAVAKNDCFGIGMEFPFVDAPVEERQGGASLRQYKDGTTTGFYFLLPFRNEELETATDAKAFAERYDKDDEDKVLDVYFKLVKGVKLFCKEETTEEIFSDRKRMFLSCQFNHGDRSFIITLSASPEAENKNKELFNKFMNSLEFYPPAPKAE